MTTLETRLRLTLLAFVILFMAGCGPEVESPSTLTLEEPAETEVTPVPGDLSETDQELLDELLALGYLEGSNPAPNAEPGAVVTLFDRERAQPGLNLMVSGHDPGALLFDMEGRTIHRWHLPYAEVWPDSKKKTWFRGDRYWRRAHLFENGDVLAIFDGLGMIKVDKNSQLLWEYHGNTHHDLHVMPDGRILSLAGHAKVIPRIHPSNLVLEDFIVILDTDGRELRRISLYDALAKSDLAHWLDDAREKGDIFHTNTIEVLDGRAEFVSPHFRKGNVLVSIHGLSAVAVLDLETQKLVWGLRGDFALQHQPTLLANGNLLLFDNIGGPPQHSRVLEIDPLTGEVVWEYQAREKDEFYTFCCGSSQRLANGNTLITDTAGGKAFEVMPDGTIVWMYQSPYRTGEENELVASLFEVVRLPPDFSIAWASQTAEPSHAPGD